MKRLLLFFSLVLPVNQAAAGEITIKLDNAVSGSVTISQIGEGHLSASQTGVGNQAVIDAFGGRHQVLLNQDGRENSTNFVLEQPSGVTEASQRGVRNILNAAIMGTNSKAFFQQSGRENAAHAYASGSIGLELSVIQTGNQNIANTHQQGSNQLTHITQFNNRNLAETSQAGINNTLILIQSGGRNTAVLEQHGTSNQLDIQQHGGGNKIMYSQFDDPLGIVGTLGRPATILQSGGAELQVKQFGPMAPTIFQSGTAGLISNQ